VQSPARFRQQTGTFFHGTLSNAEIVAPEVSDRHRCRDRAHRREREFHYHRLGLALRHYDARGHLVVARRIIDSLTPGWQQIGAVWLPLPPPGHALPLQFDPLFRSGASAILVSLASLSSLR
jgi:hypothetical protein